MRKNIPILIAALVLSLFAVRIPYRVIGPEIDASYAAVYDYAHAHGWQFGPSLRFTYGPLAFANFDWFAPGFKTWMIYASLCFTFLICLGIARLAWTFEGWKKWLFLGTAALLTLPYTAFHPGPDLVIEAGLLCWGWLSIINKGEPNGWVLAAIAATTGLFKFDFLILGAVTVLFVSVARRAFWPLLWFVILWLVGWIVLGQSLTNLPSFFYWNSQVIMGYDCFGVPSHPELIFLSVLIAGIVVPLVLFSKLTRWHKVWLLLFLMIEWKHSLTRDNTQFWACFTPLVVMPLTSRKGIVIGSLACSALLINWKQPGYFQTWPYGSFTDASQNALILIRPFDYQTQMRGALANSFASMSLPKIKAIVGDSSVDVYGAQVWAIANGLNYQPRPCFTYYFTITEALADNNLPTAKYILFRPEPIDGHYWGMEDPKMLAYTIGNYRQVINENGWRLLEKFNPQKEPKVDSVDLHLTFLGWLQRTFYHSPMATLTIQGKDYVAPLPMLKAGFLDSGQYQLEYNHLLIRK